MNLKLNSDNISDMKEISLPQLSEEDLIWDIDELVKAIYEKDNKKAPSHIHRFRVIGPLKYDPFDGKMIDHEELINRTLYKVPDIDSPK